MKLRGRLFTAFLIITCLPLLLLLITGGTIVRFQTSNLEENYNINTDTIQVLTNPLKILNRMTRSVANEIVLTGMNEPERFEDMEYIGYLNEELQSKYSFLVVRKGEEYIYKGNPEKFEKIKSYIPKFSNYNFDIDGGLYVDSDYPFLLKQQDFYYRDGSQGSILVITDVTTLVPQIKSFIHQIISSVIIVMMFTSTVLIIWIYRSILRPINILHAATNAMKEGNLDYSIEGDPEDEIGRLCVDFEEMRIRLKELIEVRLKYEEDTKELISNISHDLKTPITAIKGYAEGIMDGVADTKEKQEKYLRTIYTKANDMSTLVDELSFYSKIDCNTMPYNFTYVNIHEYFTDCIDELSLDLELKNIELSYVNKADKGLMVLADAEQLKRVVNNIIGNSVKYIINKKGLIQARIKDLGDFVEVAVEDNGCGIPKKDLPFIFDRFYRGDASRNTSKGGTGLGLAIVKTIIEDHMGTVRAESKEGIGTTIYFTLKKYKEEYENE